MDFLSKSLIKSFLPESIDGKEVTAVFGGGFKPPTAGHLSVIQKALKDNPEIDNVIIYIGSKVRDGITQDQSFKIWDEHYKTLIDKPVRVEKAVSPIGDIYRYAKDNPEDAVYWVIGAREGKEDDLQDITSRSVSIDKYPNLSLKIITTPDGGMSGTNTRQALINNDKESFLSFIPSNVNQGEIWNILTSTPLNESDPKKGTGKKPKGSGRRLYTDENPKDTVGIKFRTKEDIVDTLNKTSFKNKSHARQSQIINLIHQRIRAAYGKAKDPEIKSRLKRGLDYIEKKKEASKEKTKRLRDITENIQNQDIKFKRPKLNYSYTSLQPYIDKETMEEHFDKHFKGYTDKLNAELDEKKIRVEAEDQIQAIQKILGKYPKNNTIKNNGGGFYNHVLYFENMTPDYKSPSSKFRKMLEENFNSFSEFKDKFKEAGLKQFGSGWVFLIKKGNKLVIESYANQDNPYLDKDFKGEILIAMDVWEHAYYLKHKSQRGKYIGDFFRVIDYKVAEERLKEEEILGENIGSKTQKMYGGEPLPEIIKEDILDRTDLVLPRGKKIILQAEEENYDRGLIVELSEEGGYKMNYWYGDDVQIYPVEVEVDGESIKPDAIEVYMKFHPELKKENVAPNHDGKSSPYGSGYKPLKENKTTHKVIAKGVVFEPKNITINVGDTVEWENKEGYHNVNGKTSHPRNKNNPESFGNKVGSGWTYKFTFTKPGLYKYHCDPHLSADMVGTVKVKGINETGLKIAKKNMDDYKRSNTLNENTNPSLPIPEDGSAAPYDSGYNKLDEAIVGNSIVCDNCGWNWKIADGGDDLFICHKCGHDNTPLNEAKPYKHKHGFDKNLGKDPFGLNQFAREIMQEEKSFDTFDYPKHIKSLTKFMLDKGMKLRPLPTVKFINDDRENAKDFFGKTAYYDPNNHKVVLYTLNRHPKDVMRSFAHEMIHHMQNYEGKLQSIHTQNTNEEGNLPEIEREAYEKGNMTFRSWTDTLTEGILKEGRYDTLSNQISRDIFNFWKEDFDEGEEDSTYEDDYNFPPRGIQVYAQIIYKPGFGKLKIDGGSDYAYIDKETGKKYPGFVEVTFVVDPKMLPEFWEEISMNLKDVVRHEIEHVTQSGDSKTKKEDFDEDFDMNIRALVKANVIPQAEYFKLPKEIDANLQGMYFRAKKEKRPFIDVINTYLDAQDITPKEKQIVLNLWRSRRKALSLPKF